MNKGDDNPKSAPSARARSQRLGAALRENLKRRKAQARTRKGAGGNDEAGKARRGRE